MQTQSARVTTGVQGLDAVLSGGLPQGRLYQLDGPPGTGNTTQSLQFLLQGMKEGEKCLYITLSETAEELREVAAAHNWSLDGLHLFELGSAEQALGNGRLQSVLHSWEVELDETVKLIQAQVDRIGPSRVVFDSLSELRLLAQDSLRYRRQILALKQFFAPKSATVILVDDLTSGDGERDGQLHSLCHGVISLERLTLDFGAARRRLQVQKLRGVDFVAGYHDMNIRTGGLQVFPRLIASEHHQPFSGEPLASGVDEIDTLLGGGPLRGTSTLLTGPAGSGKTNVALQYVWAACERGEKACVFEFDERIGTLITRAKALGIDLQPHLASGRLEIVQMDPAEISPGEFASNVQRAVEERGCAVLVIDSLNGYVAATPQEKQLMLQLHELLSYLNQKGVATLLVNPQNGLVGTMSTGNLNVSYIADAVILFRFFEAQGRIRKAVSVIKNRGGAHEDTIRELKVNRNGISLSTPLNEFKGILTGTPEFVGDSAALLGHPNAG